MPERRARSGRPNADLCCSCISRQVFCCPVTSAQAQQASCASCYISSAELAGRTKALRGRQSNIVQTQEPAKACICSNRLAAIQAAQLGVHYFCHTGGRSSGRAPTQAGRTLNKVKICQSDARAAGAPTQTCVVVAYHDRYFAARSRARRRSRRVARLATSALRNLPAAPRPSRGRQSNIVQTQEPAKACICSNRLAAIQAAQLGVPYFCHTGDRSSGRAPTQAGRTLNKVKICQSDARAAGAPTQTCVVVAYHDRYFAARSRARRRSRRVARLATLALRNLPAAPRPSADTRRSLFETQEPAKLASAAADWQQPRLLNLGCLTFATRGVPVLAGPPPKRGEH